MIRPYLPSMMGRKSGIIELHFYTFSLTHSLSLVVHRVIHFHSRKPFQFSRSFKDSDSYTATLQPERYQGDFVRLPSAIFTMGQPENDIRAVLPGQDFDMWGDDTKLLTTLDLWLSMASQRTIHAGPFAMKTYEWYTWRRIYPLASEKFEGTSFQSGCRGGASFG